MANVNGEGEASLMNEIQVLYEDDDVLVINKPAGLVVHSDGRTDEPTVVDWLLRRIPTARGVGEPGSAPDGTPLERSGVVHRLDRETSGILILAKTQPAFEFLKEQFHDRHVAKEYRAFVYGTMKDEWGHIARPIGRSSKDFRLRSAQRGARGVMREAVTDWKCIEQSNSHAYLAIFPKTGRTHQIRVHLKAIDRPIVGDTLYAPAFVGKGNDLGFTRLALHAFSLTLSLPSGEKRVFTAPLPEEFEVARATLARRD